MKLKDIAAISGKPGLFRVLKPTRNGMIVESLDKQRKKSMVNATHRVSILKEISIYTSGTEDSVSLGKVMEKIQEKYGKECDPGNSGAELQDFMESVLPDFDQERVYDSDIKKLGKWYNILQEFAPDTFEGDDEEEEGSAEEEQQEEEGKEKE